LETAAFVKTTVGTEDLLPWTDVSNNLISWTVEASDDELAQLQGYVGIDQITKLDLPAQPTQGSHASVVTTRTLIDTAADDGLSKRQDAAQERLVWPKDGKNKSQCAETEKFLKDLTKADIVPPCVFRDVVQFWTVNMTDSQVNEAKKNPGVEAVNLNEAFEFACAPPP
jgi:hypothetical protein